MSHPNVVTPWMAAYAMIEQGCYKEDRVVNHIARNFDKTVDEARCVYAGAFDQYMARREQERREQEADVG